MPSDLPRYTLRIPQEMLAKIRYIADSNGRSANKEIKQVLKAYIRDFESQHGVIETADQ